MNEANELYEELQSRKQAMLNSRKGSISTDETSEAPPLEKQASGNGESKRSSGSATTKNGTLSPTETDSNKTPNG